MLIAETSDLVQIFEMLFKFLTAAWASWISWQLIKTRQGQADATAEVKRDNKVQTDAVKSDNRKHNEDMKKTLAVGDEQKNQKLDKIITLTNGKNTAALLKAAIALRRVADRFGSPDDVQAALDAEREYKESAAADALTHAVVAGHDSGIIR